MTDAGYVAGGYGVTIVAIGAYIGHMWARNRAIVRLTATPHRSGHLPHASGDAERDQDVEATSDGPPPRSGGRSGPPGDGRR